MKTANSLRAALGYGFWRWFPHLRLRRLVSLVSRWASLSMLHSGLNTWIFWLCTGFLAQLPLSWDPTSSPSVFTWQLKPKMSPQHTHTLLSQKLISLGKKWCHKWVTWLSVPFPGWSVFSCSSTMWVNEARPSSECESLQESLASASREQRRGQHPAAVHSTHTLSWHALTLLKEGDLPAPHSLSFWLIAILGTFYPHGYHGSSKLLNPWAC